MSFQESDVVEPLNQSAIRRKENFRISN